MFSFFAEQCPFEKSFSNLLARAWHGDCYPKSTLDALVLADKDIQNHSINRVIGAIVCDDTDLRFILAKTIHSTFTLLMTGGIPSKVIMQHGVEVLLKIYSLRQAVSADQYILALLSN